MELLTLTDAARLCGVTRKSLARKVERGGLPSKLDDAGRRVVPRSALEAAGLHPRSGAVGAAISPSGDGEPHGEPRVPVDISPLLARLEALSAENGRLKALTEVSSSTEMALRDELNAVRAKVTELEAAAGSRRRWFRRSAA